MAVRPLIQGLMTARLPEERLKYVMGLMLFLPAHELAERVDIRDLPEWFHEEFMRFILKPAGAFWDQAEQETAFQQMQRPLEAIHKSILQNPQDRLTQKLAMTFSENASFLPCYFSSQPLKSLLVQRGEILAFALRHRGCELDHRFPARRASSQPIRLGIYSRSIHVCPETFATLPLLEYMDRAMFQVHLYVHHSDSNRIEEGARNMVDRFSVLPQSANQSAAIIRSDDLDYLIFANNLTSAYGPGVVLASHRLARTQMIQFCNPVTSGLPHIDRVLIGSLMLQGIGMENEFTEKRLIIEGSGLCFTVDLSPASSEFRISRHDLGIAPNRIVFLSGANLFKVTPRLRRTWARVLQGVPDSHLVLYPFGPAWAADYPKKAFIEEFTRNLVEHGLDPGRLVVLDTVKDREQVSAWNRIADIYLDAVPYSGATSLLDPLQAGLPPIVMEGRELRFAQGAALMKELGVSELVTRNEDEYLRLAVRLGTDKCLRERLRGRIIERMSAGPGFLNPRQYGRRVSSALLSIFPDSISRTGRETGTPLASKVWQPAAVP
jgi:predicted O-linked N-acetylglucosamine transferase (SPINDLY family)